MNNTDRQQRINDMRAMLDWLEAHPEVKAPYPISTAESWSIYCHDDKAAFMTAVAAFNGDHEPPSESLGDIEVSRRFGSYTLNVRGEADAICEKVVVGHETKEIVEWRLPEFNGVADVADVADLSEVTA